MILIAVSHKKFIEMGKKKIVSFAKKRNVISNILDFGSNLIPQSNLLNKCG